MTTIEGLPLTMRVEDAGQLLGMSRTSAYRAAARGELPTIRLNGRLHVPTARLRSLLGYSSEAPPRKREKAQDDREART